MLPKKTIAGTELDASVLCYGLASFNMAERGEVIDRQLGRFAEAGGNFVDSAHCYAIWLPDGDGSSERCLGDFLKRNGREGWIIATKGGHPSARGYRTVDRYLSPQRLQADVQDSLGRLGVDCIDLYWLHRDDPRVPVGEVIDALAELREAGLIRYAGASNWSTQRIEAANADAAARDRPGFVASQPHWCLAKSNSRGDGSMVYAGPDEQAWHTQTGLPMIPWQSTAQGYFATCGERAAKTYDNDTSRARLERVQQLAGELGVTTNQIALAYLLSQPFPVYPIIGTRDLSHLNDALGAAAVSLSARQLSWLENG